MTPIWLSAFGALLVVSFLSFEAWIWATADSTLVVVIRHAEKAAGEGDETPLTPEGEARAARLARLFGSRFAAGHIDAIYVSPLLRSRSTAAPLAAQLGVVPIVMPARDVKALARRMLREHSGGRILVVGHRDSVPDIVAALTGAREVPPIGAEDYGTMYIVTVPRVGRGDFLRVDY